MATNFQARFVGKCIVSTCKFNNVISIGQLITWDWKRKGATMHVECMSDYQKADYVGAVESQHVEATKATEEIIESANKALETSDNDDLARLLAESIKMYLPAARETKLDEKRVREIAGELFVVMQSEFLAPTEVIVHSERTQETKDLGKQHHLMPVLLQVLSAKNSDGHSLNVWLTGPAGSGKTTAARVCSEALGLEFRFCGALDNQYGLIGYSDANGKTVRTPFREAYEHGGVFLFDEVDASSPNAILCFNAALANGHCAFPDAIVPRHKDCVIVAAANTWGLGATNDYVGRMKLDAAFIDRFVQLSWDIDESLETNTCGNKSWSKRVQSIRKAVKTKGLKVVISPRASYYGSALLAAGLSQEVVETMTLKKAMTDDQWKSVNEGY